VGGDSFPAESIDTASAACCEDDAGRGASEAEGREGGGGRVACGNSGCGDCGVCGVCGDSARMTPEEPRKKETGT
jgi:hypothetical protein